MLFHEHNAEVPSWLQGFGRKQYGLVQRIPGHLMILHASEVSRLPRLNR